MIKRREGGREGVGGGQRRRADRGWGGSQEYDHIGCLQRKTMLLCVAVLKEESQGSWWRHWRRRRRDIRTQRCPDSCPGGVSGSNRRTGADSGNFGEMRRLQQRIAAP